MMKGHQLLLEFAHEFEDLYYQRMESRIHFVRQSIHLLTHIAPETFRAGPLACYAQWTLETAIGNLGREIRLDRKMFANLTERAILRAQTNSLQARFPAIQFEVNDSPSRNTREFDGGYTFHPRCEKYPSQLEDNEREALMVYWRAQRWPNEDSWPGAVCRWSMLQLPNGQRARSVWQESSAVTDYRRSSCVEVSILILFVLGFACSNSRDRSVTLVICVLQMRSFTSVCALAIACIPWPRSTCFLCRMPGFFWTQAVPWLCAIP